MALIERLMHEEQPYIHVHAFFAAIAEIVAGQLTPAAVKTYLQMDTAAEAEFDAWIAQAPGTAAGQALYIERTHAVFILAEERVPGYDTPANVRTKLSL